MKENSHRPESQLVIDAKKRRALSKEEVAENDEFLDKLKKFAESKIDSRSVEFINEQYEKFSTLLQHGRLLIERGDSIDSQLSKAIFEGVSAIAREINVELQTLRNQIIDDAIAEYPDRIDENRQVLEYEYLYRKNRSEGLPEPYRDLNDIVNQVLKEKLPFVDTMGLWQSDDETIIGIKR